MRKIIKKIMLVGLLMVSINGLAQSSPVSVNTNDSNAKTVKNVEAGFDGLIAASYGSKAFGINVGGPSLKYKFTKNFKVGVGAFPSLLIMDDKAQPRLAVSPIVEYKHFMLITPYYGYNTKNKQIWTFGLGYKFF
ncbi:hypothetical protein GR160_12975 [Flavobacterium sp. Sd200]|uniref:hypothetical protein n=1 Tax=Flavobacterium sp. Sd200 TaxID=2692211 RepID=UPI001371923C|nr:hypothetical protein [Flavobacterium sp. Sd200]MXN92140.1 hypothetical protein [Flavobacterium sp. Sd200]